MERFWILSGFQGVLQGTIRLAGVVYCWAGLEPVECPLVSWSAWIRS